MKLNFCRGIISAFIFSTLPVICFSAIDHEQPNEEDVAKWTATSFINDLTFLPDIKIDSLVDGLSFEEYFEMNEPNLDMIEGIYDLSWEIKLYNFGKLVKTSLQAREKYAIVKEGGRFRCYVIKERLQPLKFGRFTPTETERLYFYSNEVLEKALDKEIRSIINYDGTINSFYTFSEKETKKLMRERFIAGDIQTFKMKGERVFPPIR
ncbi:hypothetical protein QQ008_07140 [Fulvivirgaceae bacterium BMA10]|uniref:Uncharacterized protein n=1 Tax=Splendidivirga corallicola TaxID=3051826 RepID=A0ABT8KLM0_9BACT|nr:hypothetical protein [Fulvivirgaceae bacterium BMA10]